MSRSFFTGMLALSAIALTACGGAEAESGRDVAYSPSARPVQAEVAAPIAAPTDAAVESVAGPAAAASGDAPAAPGTAVPSEAEPTRSPAPADQESAEAILRRAERVYAETRSLEADFVQSVTVPLLGSEQRSRGKIYHRRPDRFLMKFTEPAGDVLVADGEYFWMYHPSVDASQVMRSPMSRAGGEIDLQKEFLSRPTERYVVTLLGKETVSGRPAHVLSLVPKGRSSYKLVKIWVDAEDHLVRRFEMTEENESVRRLELGGIRRNHALPDAIFTFSPPPGAKVFTQ